MINSMVNSNLEPMAKGEAFPILDSRLITATNLKMYHAKLIQCGDYIQLYLYDKPKFVTNKRNKDFSDDKLKNKLKINKMFESFEKKQKNNLTNLKKEIKLRNIIRSKLACQRIAKANFSKWHTFITLTFAENQQDIKKANRKFHNFVRQVQRKKKDFSYIAIPEFQKRGAIHYHLLTNISINDTSLIFEQEDNPKFKHIKYWNEGFTSVEIMTGDIRKIVGYISKYMTKDIDNRLFGFRRFLYSQNLVTPKENYINFDNKIELSFYTKKIQDTELVYQSEYINPRDNTKVQFLELIPSNIVHQKNVNVNNFCTT